MILLPVTLLPYGCAASLSLPADNENKIVQVFQKEYITIMFNDLPLKHAHIGLGSLHRYQDYIFFIQSLLREPTLQQVVYRIVLTTYHHI